MLTGLPDRTEDFRNPRVISVAELPVLELLPGQELPLALPEPQRRRVEPVALALPEPWAWALLEEDRTHVSPVGAGR